MMTPAMRPSSNSPVSAPRTVARAPDLALRLAQRAFAAALEASARPSGAAGFPEAMRHRAARRSLSALSADDRQRLLAWLALQLACAGTLESLARIDAALAERVDRLATLPRRVPAAVTSGTSSTRRASPLFGLPAAG